MRLLIFLFLALTFQGCMSVSSLQSGRTVGKGNEDQTFYLNYGGIIENHYAHKDSTFILPFVLGYKSTHGASEQLDISGAIDLTLLTSVQLKYQFLGNKQSIFAGSAGVDLGLNIVATSQGLFFSYTSVPLYLSYHPSEKLTIYATPRYVFVSTKKMQENIDGTKVNWLFKNEPIGSLGVTYGTRTKFSIEAVGFARHNFVPRQVSIGVSFPVKK